MSMVNVPKAQSADEALDELRDGLPRALELLADVPSDESCAELEKILGWVTEAYGRARMAREDGTYPQAEEQSTGPAEFPVSLTPTAVMLTVDRLLHAADLNTFELALWQHVGRYQETSGPR